ncbi:MAG: AMIN domain-containing protein [Helicobacteraceae bacterium]|jgi:hypothetical protein|nr:AMIN domain-containing protein [Helicobacteraceae bacterium]
MKTICVAGICCVFALARLNPFEPIDRSGDRNDSSSFPTRQLEQVTIELPPSSRALREIKITHQENDGSISTINRKVDESIDWRAPLRIDQPNARKLQRQTGAFLPIDELATHDRVKFFIANDIMKIETKDRLIRNFFLPRPSRVALDFNGSVPFDPIGVKLKEGRFAQIELSFHETFYRVIVTLDSYYPYAIEKVSEGYLLGLN